MRMVFQVEHGDLPPKQPKHPNTEQYLQRVTRYIELQRPTHFAHAVFLDRCSVLALEDALNDWIILVNRSYVGREWHTPALKYRGMVAFSETLISQDDHRRHAYLLVRSPHGADANEFCARASRLFEEPNEFSSGLRRHMDIAPIEALGSDSESISTSYVSRLRQK